MQQTKTQEENKSLPIKNWNEVVNGKINVPDELDTIVNKVGMQINFMLYSGKSKEETICDIVAGCQDYFTQYRNLPNDGWNYFEPQEKGVYHIMYKDKTVDTAYWSGKVFMIADEPIQEIIAFKIIPNTKK